MSSTSLCTIPLLVVLVISPIQTTCDLKSPKTLFLSYGTASVDVVLFQISNTDSESEIKPPIALLSKKKLSELADPQSDVIPLIPLIGRITIKLQLSGSLV